MEYFWRIVGKNNFYNCSQEHAQSWKTLHSQATSMPIRGSGGHTAIFPYCTWSRPIFRFHIKTWKMSNRWGSCAVSHHDQKKTVLTWSRLTGGKAAPSDFKQIKSIQIFIPGILTKKRQIKKTVELMHLDEILPGKQRESPIPMTAELTTPCLVTIRQRYEIKPSFTVETALEFTCNWCLYWDTLGSRGRGWRIGQKEATDGVKLTLFF